MLLLLGGVALQLLLPLLLPLVLVGAVLEAGFEVAFAGDFDDPVRKKIVVWFSIVIVNNQR